MFLMTLLEFSNITTISLLIPKSLQKQYETRNQVIFAAVGISVVLLGINYLVLITNTSDLYNKYKGESNKQKVKGVILSSIYSIFSILSIYFVSNYINA
jgi:hypothetical protein